MEPLLEGLDSDISQNNQKLQIPTEKLNEMFILDNIKSNKSSQLLEELGHIDGLCKNLYSDKKKGINMDDELTSERIRIYGDNKPIERKKVSFFKLLWEALDDTILRILIIAATISLIIGIIEEPSKGWLEGTAILVAVIIVVLVTAINNYIKEIQFRKLDQAAQMRLITVKREEDHRTDKQISVFDLLVGDIIKIGSGDIIPVDSVLIESNNIIADESSMTGEPDNVNKGYGDDESPFLISGSQITDGSGTALVLAVGKNSFQGKNYEMLQQEETDETPLQQKLNWIAFGIGKVGLAVAIMTFLVLIIYLIIDVAEDGWVKETWSRLISDFIISITIIVVAVPEGLPLAVTLSLAYSVNQMKLQNNLVRHLDASETMGQATNICTDKTGTLTQNIMEVVSIYTQSQKLDHGFNLKENTKNMLIEHCCCNTTASISVHENKETFTGSRTEIALLKLVRKFGVQYEEIRDSAEIFFQVPFSSKTKKMVTVIEKNDFYLILVKGASEAVLECCDTYWNKEEKEEAINGEMKNEINKIISGYAQKALRTLTMAYKRVDKNFSVKENVENLTENLTLLAIIGIEDPLREEVPDAVKKCQNAGIIVRMVTGDNRDTAVSIAKRCNILPEDYIDNEEDTVMLGSEFRERSGYLLNESDNSRAESQSIKKQEKLIVGNFEEFKKIMKKLRVLARSSPEDKFILITGLRQMNEIVAVTGDGTNDAPALKKSNVGFAMHQAGTQLAQQASDIILLDDNFASIVTAVLWGRNIYECISKFIQFQLTVNIVALILSFVGAIVLHKAPLTAVQMLWVNLIMDTFAALALATEPPDIKLLENKPIKSTDSLLTPDMLKNIIAQVVFQCTCLFMILFLMPAVIDMSTGTHFTIFFNTFVFLQIFNEINCRKVKSDEKNVFKGITKNWIFLGIIIGTAIIQVLLVQFGGQPANTVPLTFLEHLFCIVIGTGALKIGILVRFLPSPKFDFLKFSEEPIKRDVYERKITGFIRRRSKKFSKKTKSKSMSEIERQTSVEV
ncbi:unnamed protein product [Blepharisma stoltei]|uniref:Calcium-transporting ATPase n=1 Tax=Blepharisma stoltei TaxID=1481888 RepID=A0AAU9K5K1_9CILI|nr:unnamed protein product [Blepharisma stoltei]